GGSISDGGIFRTSEAELTINPSRRLSSSTTRIRFFLSGSIAELPNRFLKSITGMIFPRRLITPSIISGAFGTAVISGTRTISRTEPICTPYVSSPMRNPTSWQSFCMRRAPLGTTHFRELILMRFLPRNRPPRHPFTPVPHLARPVDHEPVHAIQQVPRQFQHLLRSRGKFR